MHKEPSSSRQMIFPTTGKCSKKCTCYSFSDNKVVGRHHLSSLEKLVWIQLDLRLPDEDDSDEVEVEVPPSGDVRRLGDSHLNYVAGKGQTYETETAASTGRQLQESTTQVCYFVFYNISTSHTKRGISYY